MTLDDFFVWLLADLTDSDSAPSRDDTREPSNSVHSRGDGHSGSDAGAHDATSGKVGQA